MNYLSVAGPWAGPDQGIDPERKGERPDPANRTRDSETRADSMKMHPDQQAILALQRVSGAHAHQANGLIHVYTSACYLGKVETAEAAKRDMTALAVKCIQESLASDSAREGSGATCGLFRTRE